MVDLSTWHLSIWAQSCYLTPSPDSPKNSDTSPAAPTLAPECNDRTLRLGMR